MQDNEKKPALRFKGFTDPWEQRKISELAEKTYGGGTPTTSNEAFWNGNIPWIQSSDIVDGKLMGVEPRKYITQTGLNNSATQLVPKDSIAIITRVGVGKLAYMPFSYSTSQDFLSLSKLNTEPFFTVYACYKKLQSELNTVQGTSIKGITKDELLAKTISVPVYSEQKQIGSFFTQLDTLITLHQRKYEKLLNIKKSMLDKMFPQNGVSVPEIRFKGFTDPWEQRKLGEVFEEYSEKNHAELPPLTIIQGGGTIRRDESERALQYDKSSLSNYKMVNKDDFIVHLRSFEGGLEKASSQGIISPAYHTFHGEDVDSRFYYAYFRSKNFINKDLKPHVYGIRDGRSIDIEGMKTIRIPWASYPEQKSIGDFLTHLDTLITLHQRKLEKLQNIKKSCLEKMFV